MQLHPLENSEIEISRTIYGKNQLKKGKRKSFFRCFLTNLNDPIIKVLIVALIINTLVSLPRINYLESIGILASVLIATLVSTISEYSSENAFEKLKNASQGDKVLVKRSGGVKAGEEEKLTERRDKLLHLEKINRQVSLACRALCDGEKATVTALCDRAEAALSSIAGIIPECDGLMERIASIRAEAEDIADLVREFGDEDVGDPTAELDKLEGRLDIISRLGRKYGEGVEAILAFREEAAARLVVIDTADERIEELEQEEAGLNKRLADRAHELTAIRKTAARALSEAVQEALAFLDMPKVRFEVAVKPAAEFGAYGCDEVEFLLSANPGEPVGPMVRIASGGELSRIMLAIRSVLNQRYGVPTAIYDEVDTGISGRTARKVGIKLATIAKGSQVICVTHSAQIGSLADAHYVIEKKETVTGGETRAETSVRRIEEADRVEEIARILGGLDVTDSQRAAARELIAGKEGL